MKSPRFLLAFALAALGAVSLSAQISIGSLTSSNAGTTYTYTQNFDTLPFQTTVSPTAADSFSKASLQSAAPGWLVNLGATSTLGSPSTTEATYQGFTGDGVQSSATVPTLRNYGNTSSTDRALGLYVSTSTLFGTGALGVVFQNTTGYAITSFTLGYTGELWRRGTTGRLEFAYQTLESYNSSFNIRTSSGWTDVNALDFQAPISGSGTGINGNGTTSITTGSAVTYWNGTSYVTATSNTVVNNYTVFAPLLVTLDTPLAAGESIVLRWSNTQTIGGMGLDDVSVSFTAIPEPSTYAAIFGALALVGVVIHRRRRQG